MAAIRTFRGGGRSTAPDYRDGEQVKKSNLPTATQEGGSSGSQDGENALKNHGAEGGNR
ncbi:unnamed protein product, partial [Amoebophrya sp. A25]